MAKALCMTLVGWLGLCLSIAVKAEQAPLTLGVHPYLAPQEVVSRFQPLADYLSAHIDRPTRVLVGTDYASHLREAGLDHLDMAFLGPAVYVRLVREYGPKPLLARLRVNGSDWLFGEIVVRRESPIQTLADLRGHSFAFGSRLSTMGTVVPRALLATVGVDTSNLGFSTHLEGHNNVAMAVLSGMVDAGAVKREIYTKYRGGELRSLQATPAVPEHVLVARGDLPAELIARLRELLLHAQENTQGLAAARAIHHEADGFAPAEDGDYAELRRLMSE